LLRPTAAAPELYVNQLASSVLRWKEQGVQLDVDASLYAPGNMATAQITVSLLKQSAAPVALNIKVAALGPALCSV
jgi:hypothetical protein